MHKLPDFKEVGMTQPPSLQLSMSTMEYNLSLKIIKLVLSALMSLK